MALIDSIIGATGQWVATSDPKASLAQPRSHSIESERKASSQLPES